MNECLEVDGISVIGHVSGGGDHGLIFLSAQQRGESCNRELLHGCLFWKVEREVAEQPQPVPPAMAYQALVLAGRSRLEFPIRRRAHVAFIRPEAEFTPKNVQTREERERLVSGVKALLDNADQALKPGVPVEVALPR